MDVGPLTTRAFTLGRTSLPTSCPSRIAQEEIFGPVLACSVRRPRRGMPHSQRHGLCPDRRPLLAQPGALARARRSCWSATCTSTARSPAPWSDANRSADSSCPASAPRPAAATICCSLSSRGRSPRIRCAAGSHRCWFPATMRSRAACRTPRVQTPISGESTGGIGQCVADGNEGFLVR